MRPRARAARGSAGLSPLEWMTCANSVTGDLNRMMRMPPATPRPLRIFFAYAHADEELRDKLDSHLAALKHEGRVEVWHDRRISPGYDWRLEIGRELETADIILLSSRP